MSANRLETNPVKNSVSRDDILEALKTQFPVHIFPEERVNRLVETLKDLCQWQTSFPFFSLEDIRRVSAPYIFSAFEHANSHSMVLWFFTQEAPKGLLFDINRLTALTVEDMRDDDVIAEIKRAEQESESHPNFTKLWSHNSPVRNALGRFVAEGELLAKLVLRSKGIPFKFFVDNPIYVENLHDDYKPDSWIRLIIAELNALTHDAEARLAAMVLDQVHEFQYHQFINTQVHEFQYHQFINTQDHDFIALKAMQLGMSIERMYQNRKHGRVVEGRRRATEAIKKSQMSSDDQELIRARFTTVRVLFKTDAETYRQIIKDLPSLDLSEAQVRHVVKPTRKKTKK